MYQSTHLVLVLENHCKPLLLKGLAGAMVGNWTHSRYLTPSSADKVVQSSVWMELDKGTQLPDKAQCDKSCEGHVVPMHLTYRTHTCGTIPVFAKAIMACG
jgi:hypothetical protein